LVAKPQKWKQYKYKNSIVCPNIHDLKLIISRNLPTNKFLDEDKMDRAI
jgi:hypothetical protein